MARLESTLIHLLVLYLTLLPFSGIPAEAQGSRRPVATQRPIAPPGPTGPSRPVADGETIFTPAAATLTLRAFNGFSSDSTPGLFHHRGHGHAGGMATVTSPWGEQLEIRYWLTPRGITVEYDGDLRVRYRFDELGTLDQIVAETSGRVAHMAVGNRAELVYLGQKEISSFDMSAYVLIDEALRGKHSDAFLEGLARSDAPAAASCATQGIQCGVCILAWAASVAAIASACIVGGVPTFGAACFSAILAHEATNFSCAATCIAWYQDCFGGGPDGVGSIPDGCEP